MEDGRARPLERKGVKTKDLERLHIRHVLLKLLTCAAHRMRRPSGSGSGLQLLPPRKRRRCVGTGAG